MSTQVIPHLNFRGQARAALEHYRSVFGGEITVATYADMHQGDTPEEAKLVMWGQVAARGGFRIQAFDATAKVPFDRGQNAFYVTVGFDTEEEAKGSWEKLISGGKVRRELGPAPWGAKLYGMAEDRFGVVWIVSVA